MYEERVANGTKNIFQRGDDFAVLRLATSLYPREAFEEPFWAESLRRACDLRAQTLLQAVRKLDARATVEARPSLQEAPDGRQLLDAHGAHVPAARVEGWRCGGTPLRLTCVTRASRGPCRAVTDHERAAGEIAEPLVASCQQDRDQAHEVGGGQQIDEPQEVAVCACGQVDRRSALAHHTQMRGALARRTA